MDKVNKITNKSTSADELIKGFKNIFFKKFGIYPEVTYSRKQLDAELTLEELYEIIKKVRLKEDPSLGRSLKETKSINKSIKIYYKYSFMICAAEMGYIYADIAKFLKTSTPLVNYAIRSQKDAEVLKDPASCKRVDIHRLCIEAVNKELYGTI